MITRVARRLARARAESGLRWLVSETAYLARTAAALPAVTLAEAAFDRRRGIRTRGRLRHEAALAPLALGGDPVHYEPADRRSWKKVTSTIPIERGAATFVDLGCGLGRAVILAAEAGFGRVIGVQLDERLAEEAGENVRRWQSRRRTTTAHGGQDVVIVQGDAATYRLPDGPLVIWLYNPFGATTLRQVLRRLRDADRSPEAPVLIAYVYPVHLGVFDEFPRMVPHSRGGGWHVYRLVPTSPDGTRSGPGTPSTGASSATRAASSRK